MPDQEFSVSLSADVSQLLDSMDSAKESVVSAGEEMKASMEGAGGGMSGALEGAGEAMEGFKEKADGLLENLTALTGGWTGLLSVIGAGAVGELLERISETTTELGDSMRQTGAALNVGANEARGFNEAMSSLGVSPQAASQAIRRLEMDASNGGKQLERLGVSATTASGAMKSGEDIFLEVVEKLNNLSDANQRAEAGFTLLGRGASQLLGVLPQIPSAIEEATAKQQENTAANQLAEAQSLKLHGALTELQSAWEDGIIKMSPLVVGALQVIASEVDLLTKDLVKLGQEAMAAFDWLTKVAAAKSTVRMTGDIGGHGSDISGEGARSHDVSDYSHGYSPDAEVAGGEMLPGETVKGTWAPKGGGGRGGGRGGGGGADPMAGVDDSLISSQVEMNKLAAEFQKLWSESQMAAKASETSFADLRAKAVQDYQQMMDAHKAFADAVQKGDAEAAKASEKDWKDATKEFQQDWEQAKQKATQDMQQIKSTADTMASEVSGILNSALSGKLNWAQEFDKILSQMIDKLIKKLFEMIAAWASHEAQVLAVQSSGAASGLAVQKAANTAAGTSDAVTAAKGAYASAAQIPYIGWIIAPVAAAAAFAGVEAFGSAEGGYSVPPGESPLIQMHPRELAMPSNLSEGFRDIIRNGGGGRGGGTVNQNLNIQSLDPSSLADIVMRNPDIFGKAAALSRRNGARFNTG